MLSVHINLTEIKFKALKLVQKQQVHMVRLCNKSQLQGEEDVHIALCASYDEIIKQPKGTVETGLQRRNELRSISSTGNCVDNNFLCRTIRALNKNS